MTNSERLALFARGSRAPVLQQLRSAHHPSRVSVLLCLRYLAFSCIHVCLFSLVSPPCPTLSLPPSLQSQVSFRYHCQLYSEWRRTNQKVRLLMPDMKGAHTTQRSVPTKSTKKMTDETIV